MQTNPPTENDGPAGAVAISRVLRVLGKRVFLLTDDDNAAVIAAAMSTSDLVYGNPNPDEIPTCLISFPEGDVDAPAIISKHSINYLVAVERCGPAADGMCYTMTGRNLNLSQRIARLEQLFTCR